MRFTHPLVFIRILVFWGHLLCVLSASGALAQDLSEARRIDIARKLQEATVVLAAGNSTGSGFVVAQDGLIVTNLHVVSIGQHVPLRVRYGDGSVGSARVVAIDQEHDLALVMPDSEHRVRPLELASGDEVHVGQTVLAFGSPFGLDGTLTQGIVSARRDLPGSAGVIQGVIQTDAPINPGNSGGPLVSSRGEVIGVTTSILSRSGGNQGIGFAVPARYVRALTQHYRQQSTEQRLSLRDQNVQTASRASLGCVLANGDKVVRIVRVTRGGPAHSVGLRGAEDPPPDGWPSGMRWTGFEITGVDGRSVTSLRELDEALAQHQRGDTVWLAVSTGDGQVGVVRVELTGRAQPPRRGARGKGSR